MDTPLAARTDGPVQGKAVSTGCRHPPSLPWIVTLIRGRIVVDSWTGAITDTRAEHSTRGLGISGSVVHGIAQSPQNRIAKPYFPYSRIKPNLSISVATPMATPRPRSDD